MKQRSGSALLIVLGMVSFMLISAVAFSAWMRYARLPSSFLRRNASVRLLAKAALAEAVDQIDIALGNDPFAYTVGYEYGNGGGYAGVGYDQPRKARQNQSVKNRRRNYWRGHCYIGSNELARAEDTVSTLSLEALAYLPPALINEVRYYSRRSTGAMWRKMSFDAGRYAFTAVDVSDHIDVNRVLADTGRNSSDGARISLAHAFSNPNVAGAPTPSQWDDFMDKFLEVDKIKDGDPNAYVGTSRLPLMSLADLNLALNEKGWNDQMSPFCRYVRSGSSIDYYQDSGSGSAMVRYMPFVTDSHTPSTNDATTASLDLCSTQPFTDMKGGKTDGQLTVDQIIPQTSDMLTNLKDFLTGLDIVSLYDYLDGNDVPASLGLPCVERVPMLCGFEPSVAFTFKPNAPTKALPGGQPIPTAGLTQASPPITVEHTYTMELNSLVGELNALFLYPFRDNKDADDGSFTVDCAVRIGLCVGNGPGFRTMNNSAFLVSDGPDFERNAVENGVIKLHTQASVAVPPCKGVTREEAAVLGPVTLNLTLPSSVKNAVKGETMFKVSYKYEVENQGTEENPNWQYVQKDIQQGGHFVSALFHPLNANGTGDGGFNVAKLQAGEGVEVRPFVTVTARVKSSRSSKYVDLVPACYADDKAYNMVANASVVVGPVSGDANNRPLLTFAGPAGAMMKFGEGGWESQTPSWNVRASDNGGSLICPDPRWNFAPENFFFTSEALSGLTGQNFLDKCGIGKQNRDRDIFQATSDQGYLQSVWEVAFLPRTCFTMGAGGSMTGDAGGSFTRTSFAPWADDDFSALSNGRLMWRTYTPFDRPGVTRDPIDDIGITASGKGFRIYPYTTSKEVMEIALANPPVSWWAASTNEQNSTAFDKMNSADDYNREFAFSEKNSARKLAYADLSKIAANMMAAMRRTDGQWWRGYDSLDWAGDDDHFCGAELTDTCDLYDIDRKFLHGYWRECFAARQQLFLVFVRAEPGMPGSGVIGSQLGARAVALVWRDPNPTPTNNGSSQPIPHRTRVLFYRQFD